MKIQTIEELLAYVASNWGLEDPFTVSIFEMAEEGVGFRKLKELVWEQEEGWALD